MLKDYKLECIPPMTRMKREDESYRTSQTISIHNEERDGSRNRGLFWVSPLERVKTETPRGSQSTGGSATENSTIDQGTKTYNRTQIYKERRTPTGSLDLSHRNSGPVGRVRVRSKKD